LEGLDESERGISSPDQSGGGSKKHYGYGNQSRRSVHCPGQTSDQIGGRQIFAITHQKDLIRRGGIQYACYDEVHEIVQRNQTAPIADGAKR